MLKSIKTILVSLIALAVFSLTVCVGGWVIAQFSKREFETEARNIAAVVQSGMSVVDGLVASLEAIDHSPTDGVDRSNDADQLNKHITKVLSKYNYVVGLGRFDRIESARVGELSSSHLWRYENAVTKGPVQTHSGTPVHYPLSVARFRSVTAGSVEDLTGFDLGSLPRVRTTIEKDAANGELAVIGIPDLVQRTGHLWALATSTSVKDTTIGSSGGHLLEVDIEEMVSAGGVSIENINLSITQFSEQEEFVSDVPAALLFERKISSENMLSIWIDRDRLIRSFEIGDRTYILEVSRESGLTVAIVAMLSLAGLVLSLMVLSIINLHKKRRYAQKLQRIESTKLYQEQHRASVTLASIGDTVITTDVNDTVLYANGAAETLLGYSVAQMQGKLITEIVVPQTESRRSADESGNGDGLILVSADGSTFHVDKKESVLKNSDGGVSGKVTVFRDVSLERQLTAELQHKVNHDSLTGLSSRFYFEQKTMELFASSEPVELGHAVCFIDLDRFKEVNDTCGHAAGDELLIRIARAFEKNVRDTDLVARLGGDEFGIVLRHCSRADAHLVAERIQEYFQSFYFEYAGHTFPVRCSIGLVHFYPEDSDMESVLKTADAACFDAKRQGRSSICEGDPNEASDNLDAEVQWLPLLKSAIENDNFVLYLQPIASISDDLVAAHEVLLRLTDDAGELVGAAVFMKTARRYDLALDIDKWVIRHAFEKIANMPDVFVNDRFSINLSEQTIGYEGFIGFLKQEIETAGINPSRLCFELKESDILKSPSDAAGFCRQLQLLGCTVALDDFGAAMTSLSTIKTIPANILKIDGSLIAGLSTASSVSISSAAAAYAIDDPAASSAESQLINPDLMLVRSIHSFASSMGLSTIAQQVDDDESLSILKLIDVNYVQGYAIAEPGLFDEFYQVGYHAGNSVQHAA